ncbi:tetratricopeptide repeat protein [Planctomycetota bacterium]|nr:tetratricopeptide repeat protein [Planctomycetota bacterium]
MNRPKIGWIVVTAICGSVAACGTWPTVGDSDVEVSATSETEAVVQTVDVVEAKPEKKPASGYKRINGKAGVRKVDVPEGLIAERVAPLASMGIEPNEKTLLKTEEVIERVALPEYLQNKQEDGQSHSVVNEQPNHEIGHEEAVDEVNASEVGEYDHLWKGSETLSWAEQLDGVVNVEVGEVLVPESVEDEPALEAQYAFDRGMQAMLDRDLGEAKKAFEEALEIEPENSSIMRQLGWVYTGAGNKAKGAWYFKKVLIKQPDDIEAMHLVGRHELDEGNWDQAIAMLGDVYQRLKKQEVDADNALLPLTQYYLAAALRQGGYLFAASDMFEDFLTSPKRVSGATTFGRELLFVGRQIGLIWLAAGDLRNQLDEPDVAMLMYKQAFQRGVKANEKMLLRVAYTKLRLDDNLGAMQSVAQLLRSSDNHIVTMRVVNWALSQGESRDALVDELLKVYEEKDGADEKLAIVISEVSGDKRGKLLLMEHLRGYPEHEVVFEYILKEWVFGSLNQGVNVGEVGEELRIREALGICLDAMESAPEKAGEYARLMLRMARDWSRVEKIIEQMDERERGRAVVQVVYGLSKAASTDLSSASIAFENAFERDPKLLVARLELAKMMVVMRRYDRANDLLSGVEPAKENDTEVIRLRAKMFEQQSKLESAINIYQKAIDAGNKDVLLHIGKADVQLKMNLIKQCEQTLLDAISVYPKEEQLYEAVFKLYDTRNLELSDMQRRYQRILARLMGTLPDSRIARLKRGEILAARGDYEEGTKQLKVLLEEYPRDIEIMSRVIQAYMRSNQTTKAELFIEDYAAKWQKDVGVLQLTIDYFKAVKNMEKVFVYSEKMILLEPENHQREIKLASLYVAWQKDLKAAAVLGRLIEDQTIKQPHVVVGMLWSALHRVDMAEQGETEVRKAMTRFPDHASDIFFQWAILVESTGDKQRSEELMIELLAANQNYAPANNQLGYRWVVRGENLHEAKAMIERAVKVEPENGAYMDSLGWAHYKLGEYKEAVSWLLKSTQTADGEYPVILSHLGDAYWAQGMKGEAIRVWEKARLKMENEPGRYTADRDPELDGLQETLGKKIMKAGE